MFKKFWIAYLYEFGSVWSNIIIRILNAEEKFLVKIRTNDKKYVFI